MKTLFIFLILLSLPAFGGVKWTHSVIEGEDGGIDANYFFFETSQQYKDDGTLMSVQKVRAVYATGHKGDVLIVEYSIANGIHVKSMMADRKYLKELITGKDTEFKSSSEFSIDAETSVGYFHPKTKSALTEEQLEMIYNLVYILSMQRSPIKSEQDSGGQPATRPESK